MSHLRAGEDVRRLFRWSMMVGVLLALGACGRTEAGDLNAPTPAPGVQKLAAVTPPAAPVDPVLDDLDGFEQALARKFDRSQMTTHPLPGGGVLQLPNGHVAHAAILVRHSDGTLRRECVSSSAEVSALVQKLRDGTGQ